MTGRPAARALAAVDRGLLPGVLAAGALGLVRPGPSRAAAAHHGIAVALVVLVAAAGLGLSPGAVGKVRSSGGRVLLAVLVGAVTLPLMAWAASRLVPAGPSRVGVVAIGVAPSEVATVGLVRLAGGRAAVAAAVLVGSTVVSVLAAGPVLGLLGGAGPRGPGAAPGEGLLPALVRLVALPLTLGGLLRWRAPRRLLPVLDGVSAAGGTVAVLVLVWLVAGQADADAGWFRVGLALVALLLGSGVLGGLVAAGLPRDEAVSVLLPVALRDFAVAAGIAAAAAGPGAAAPLGLYGGLVLLVGAVTARAVRRRGEPAPGGT